MDRLDVLMGLSLSHKKQGVNFTAQSSKDIFSVAAVIFGGDFGIVRRKCNKTAIFSLHCCRMLHCCSVSVKIAAAMLSLIHI